MFDRHCVCVDPVTKAKGKSSVSQGEDFCNVKKGDYFYLCYGNNCIRLFGMFTGESQQCKLPGLDGWLEQKYILYFESVSQNIRYQGPGGWWTPRDNSTFIKVNDIKNFEDWILKPFFSKTLDDIKNFGNMNAYKNLLINNYNLILTGAPGTGKTYLAKQIAKQMIFGEVKDKLTEEEEKQFNEQCGFVQFHPSYDYTDFVEGLRPIQDEDGQVGFERRDGVFKAFCKKAIDASVERGQDNFDEVWDRLIDDLNESTYMEIPILSGKRNIHIELNDYGTGLTERMYDDVDAEKIKGHSKFFTKEQLYNVYRGFRGIPSGGHDNYRKAIIQYLRDKKGLLEYSKGQEVSEKKKYIFIIDEINRGEISKIFGELFFSIDPGYRGKNGKVKTQYQNMVGQEDVFYDGFCVPENVYIIGTMNDIDRSVESMDFAFRRRFAFKEIAAEESKQMLYSDSAWGKDETGKSRKPQDDVIKDVIQRMDNVNNIIWHNAKDGESEEKKCIDGLSSAYHIGASYFLKLVNYKKEDGSFDYDKLWDNHLEGLLFEYMRSMPSARENIKRLAKEFGYTNMSKYE